MIKLFFVFLYAAAGAMTYRLFLRQAIGFQGRLGTYISDLPEHIREGTTGEPYSLMERSFGFLMNTLGFNQKAVAVLLALLVLGTIWMTWRLMRDLAPSVDGRVLHLLSFACMLVMPLFIKSVHPQRYIGLQSGTIWHNSTYLGMKFAAVCLLLLYYRLQERYEKAFSVRDFVCFTLLLVFVNLMKPNFFLCFAPAMAVMLLTDCIRAGGKTLGRQVLFGIPVVLSLAVVIYETMVLFEGDRSDSSITVALAYNLRRQTQHPVASLFQSAAFPLLVLAGNPKALKEDRVFRMSWLIWLFGLLEYLFLCENGPRKNHGNMSWGYSFCLFLVFVICICRLCQKIREFYLARQESGAASLGAYIRQEGIGRAASLLYLAASGALFAWHLICGVQFLAILYQGGSYFV